MKVSFMILQSSKTRLEKNFSNLEVKLSNLQIKLLKKISLLYLNFIFSMSLEYQIERLCRLAQVGGLLNNNGYGIALKKSTFSSASSVLFI